MTNALAIALASFQDNMPSVPKNRVARGNDGRTYTYADLADMNAAARPVLSECGLVFYTAPAVIDGAAVIRGRLVHIVSGEYIEGTLPLHGRHPQDIGSAITYARRYLLGCLTGIVTEDDDDGAAVSDRPGPVTVVNNVVQMARSEETFKAEVDALRSALAAADTIAALADIYTRHHLRDAPEDVKVMYRARVDAVRAATADATPDGDA